MMRLKDRVALVTGSSRGIGKAIALAFAQEGANIVVNYSSNEAAAKETLDNIKAMGRNAILRRADVSLKSEVDAMVEEATSKLGRIDILVNNAGTAKRDTIHTMNMDDWARVMNVNLVGALNCIRAVSQHMISNRYGKIVNISSIAGLVNSFHSGPAYVASKSALIALTKKLAIELGSYGININAIAPGAIVTDMAYNGISREEAERSIQERIKLTALRRVGKPEDIASVASFLASDESSFMTGQILVVDGGRIDFFSHS